MPDTQTIALLLTLILIVLACDWWLKHRGYQPEDWEDEEWE